MRPVEKGIGTKLDYQTIPPQDKAQMQLNFCNDAVKKKKLPTGSRSVGAGKPVCVCTQVPHIQICNKPPV